MRHINKFVPASQPQTLVGFLKSLGGLRDCQQMKIRDARLVWPGLVNNKRGRSLDHAREAAEEAGYLSAFSSVGDFLDALDKHPHYRPADMGRLVAWLDQGPQNRMATEMAIDTMPASDVASCAKDDAGLEFDALAGECRIETREIEPAKDTERGEKALAWRLSVGLSRAKLSQAIGFSPSQIQDYEEGGRRGKAASDTIISEASWRRYELACAAYAANLTAPW